MRGPSRIVKLPAGALLAFVTREACPMLLGFHDWESFEDGTEVCRRCGRERERDAR